MRTELEDFPRIINVNVLKGACPCECKHCPVGQVPKDQRVKKFGYNEMSLQIFKKIVNEAAEHPKSFLRIHGVGEPIYWKHLVEALHYAEKKNVKTWLFTCLITKDNRLIDAIAKHCTIIEVSINSIDSEDYAKTKGINQFDLAESNLVKLREFIKSNSFNTRLIVSRVQSTDQDKDATFVDFWQNSGLVDDAFVRSYHNYNGVIDERDHKSVQDPKPCLVHWARFNIDYNGYAVICFNELFKGPNPDESLVLGDIKKSCIKEVWAGNKLQLIRKAQISNDYSIINFTSKLPCLSCRFYQPLDTKRLTSENQINKINKINQINQIGGTN